MESNETGLHVELWVRVMHGAVGALLLSCNLACSCTVISVVTLNKKLHHPSMVMSLGLVMADLVLAATWNIQVIAFSVAGGWPLGDGGCVYLGLILTWMLYVRWCEVGVVALDRFFTIVFPFYKDRKRHTRFIVAMTITAWAVPGAMVLPSAFGFGRQTFRPQVSACTVECDRDRGCIGYYSALVLIFKLIGGGLPISLYIAMYCIGLKMRRKHRSRQLGTVTLRSGKDFVNVSIEDIPLRCNASGQSESTPNNTLTTIQEDAAIPSVNSSVSKTMCFRLKLPNLQERNGLVTVFIIFVSMVFTHIPIYSASALEHVGNIYETIPLPVHLAAAYIFLIGLFMDSIVIMRNKDFRDVLSHTVRKWTARRNTNVTSSESAATSTTAGEGGSRRSSMQPASGNLQEESQA